jgi:hypothetical protein
VREREREREREKERKRERGRERERERENEMAGGSKTNTKFLTPKKSSAVDGSASQGDRMLL